MITMDEINRRVGQQIKEEARAAGQFTLNVLIARLKALPQDATCELCEPHSYRGYYGQLAFEGGATWTVADALAAANGALGQMFEGYKGGEYWMTGGTMVWLAGYGYCGDRIVGLNERDGRIIVATSPDE